MGAADMRPKLSLNADAQRLVDAIRNASHEPDTIPQGWLTVAQISAAAGVPETTIRRRIEMVPHEVRKFRVLHGIKLRSVRHYRIK